MKVIGLPSWMKNESTPILKDTMGHYFTILTREILLVLSWSLLFATVHPISFKRFCKDNQTHINMKQLIHEFKISLDGLIQKVRGYGYIN